MRFITCIILMGLLAVGEANAQSSEVSASCAALLETAAKLGPSGLSDTDTGQWLTYEDRVSRQPLRAAIGYINDWRDLASACGVVGIAPKRFGLFLPAFRQNGQILALSDTPSISQTSKGPFVDLEVELLYNFAIDYPVDWFRDRIAIGPKLKVWWPNGLLFEAQYAIPIRNQLPEKHAQYWSKPYPNVLMAGFRKQMTTNMIGAVTAGFYERNRYGGDVQLYWISARWPIVLGGRAGMNGYWSFFEGKLETGPVDFFTGYIDGTVYLPWYNIRLRGRMGRFTREVNQVDHPGEIVKIRRGSSAEVTRMFGEIEIGLFGFYDGYVVYPGFRFAAPLSPKKGLKKGRIVVYPSRQLSVPYDLGRVVRGQITGFIRPKRGELHRTGMDIWDDLRMLAPAMRSNF
ncbi:hypothetical protein HQ496_14265 [bacterium]|nr:hypothetical protein [bacterium]